MKKEEIKNIAEMPLYQRMKKFATLRHKFVNQKYGKYPYSFHLVMVANFVKKFNYLIPSEKLEYALILAWGHDLIEDTRITYGEIKDKFGKEIAEGIFLLTELRGRTRKDRHGPDYFNEMKNDPIAVFVKLCDICANTTASKDTGHSMYKKYKKELPVVKSMLYKQGEFEPIWEYLESL